DDEGKYLLISIFFARLLLTQSYSIGPNRKRVIALYPQDIFNPRCTSDRNITIVKAQTSQLDLE
ncbi:MAG TPA: hypothetical protein VIH27_04235, partial [Nitrososphaerales archaeon]